MRSWFMSVLNSKAKCIIFILFEAYSHTIVKPIRGKIMNDIPSKIEEK